MVLMTFKLIFFKKKQKKNKKKCKRKNSTCPFFFWFGIFSYFTFLYQFLILGSLLRDLFRFFSTKTVIFLLVKRFETICFRGNLRNFETFHFL